MASQTRDPKSFVAGVSVPGTCNGGVPLRKYVPCVEVEAKTAEQCGVNSKDLAVFESERVREDREDTSLAGTISVVDSPEDSVEAIGNSPEGMSEAQTLSRVYDETRA